MGALWVFSEDHLEQVGFRKEGDAWVPAGKRQGPRRTVRCVSVPGPAACWCLGARESGGLRPCRSDVQLKADLPARGGYVDVAVDEEQMYVLDGPGAKLYTLSFDGTRRAERAVRAGTYALTVGDGRVWLAAWTVPHLYALAPDGTRVDARAPAAVRALRYDPVRKLLWVVGPRRDRSDPSRRRFHDWYGRLDGYVIEKGQARLEYTVDLRDADLVDPSAIALWGDRVVVAATGSRAIGAYFPEKERLTRIDVGLAPVGVTAAGNDLASVNRLDDTLTFVDRDGTKSSVELSPTSAPTLAELGEILFYDKVFGPEQSPFTCNSCHWNGGSDHRRHPNPEQRRWELTRPLAGAGMLAPATKAAHPPGQAPVRRGFFDAPVHRGWSEEGLLARALAFRVRGEMMRMGPASVKTAMLHFLTTLAAEVGPWRRADGTFDALATEGARLFLRDCVSCHEASDGMRSRNQVPPEALLETLVQRPLVFGASVTKRTGMQPGLGKEEHRVSPLLSLDRGGPFFSNGTAPDLDTALRMTHPKAEQVHDPSHAIVPYYDLEARRALTAFLLSL